MDDATTLRCEDRIIYPAERVVVQLKLHTQWEARTVHQGGIALL